MIPPQTSRNVSRRVRSFSARARNSSSRLPSCCISLRTSMVDSHSEMFFMRRMNSGLAHSSFRLASFCEVTVNSCCRRCCSVSQFRIVSVCFWVALTFACRSFSFCNSSFLRFVSSSVRISYPSIFFASSSQAFLASFAFSKMVMPIWEYISVPVSFSSMSDFSFSLLERNLVNSPWASREVRQNCSYFIPTHRSISVSISFFLFKNSPFIGHSRERLSSILPVLFRLADHCAM